MEGLLGCREVDVRDDTSHLREERFRVILDLAVDLYIGVRKQRS